MEGGGCVTNFSSTTSPIYFFVLAQHLLYSLLMEGLSATQLPEGRLELTQSLNVKPRLIFCFIHRFLLILANLTGCRQSKAHQ